MSLWHERHDLGRLYTRYFPQFGAALAVAAEVL
jgi:hypothetical protein